MALNKRHENVMSLIMSEIALSYGVQFTDINVVLMTDEEHTAMNISHLGHEYSTDILTFDVSYDDTISGDIYINWDVCLNNAKEYSVSSDEELYRLMIHGLLHLVGLNDHSDEEIKEMRNAEQRYLDKIVEKGFM